MTSTRTSNRVRVPVTVRLNGARPGDPDAPEQVRTAVQQAVRAGLARADLPAMGVSGPADVTLVAPTAVAGQDAGGGLVADVVTEEVLEAARGGVQAGVDAVLRDLVTSDTAPAQRPTGAPSEPFDPTRVRRRAGRTTYVVPFFDGGEVELPLEEEDGASGPASPPLPSMGEVVTVEQAISVAWVWHVHRYGPWWDPETFGYPGFYGMVTVDGVTQPALVWLTSVGGPISEDGTFTGGYSYLYKDLEELVLTGDPDDPFADRRISSTTVCELSSTGEEATVDSVEAWVAAAMAQVSHPEQNPLRDEAFRRAYAERMLRDPRSGELVEGLVIWRRSPGPTGAFSLLPAQLKGQAVRGPIRFVTARAAGGGPGGERGRGGEGGGRRSDGADGAGRRDGTDGRGRTEEGEGELSRYRSIAWPTRAGASTVPACGPYLAEPRMEDLVDDHGLGERMRRIAALLGIPDCSYLGGFCLSAARAVASRARAVGVDTAQSSSHTEVAVRPDGSGNNGFLDVRPGASPEFELLRVLAGAAADIYRLSQDVVSCYLDTRNRHLVRTRADLDPNAAGWGLRFSGESKDHEEHAFMHVYAETCRALLLQQLRTSRVGIDGRLENIEATSEMFSSALDAIGELVVQMSTLRLALTHSGQTFVTGTVRDVLSASRTVGHGPDRYHLPPPIRSIPSNIVDVVGDARVARRGGELVVHFQGRPWTRTELDAAVGMRRSVLNQIDPLFFQVSNLDAVYARAQQDPSSVQGFLEDLLGEMRTANTGMMEEASDPEDGAFFALEASQYVEREGGRDWRGLRFELQGIHALANDQLAPYAGSVPAYIEGINLAVARKANFDKFVGLFSTVGIIALGLLCAPLGAVAAAAITGAAGLALTLIDVQEAERQSDLYQAVLTPELFLRRQDVEMAQLMATIGIAFSIFDVFAVGRGAVAAARAVGGQLRLGRRAVAQAGREAAGEAAETGSRRVLVDLSEEMLGNAMRQAVSEAAVMAVLDRLLPLAITPVLVPWLRRQAQERGVLSSVDEALGDLAVQGALRELADEPGGDAASELLERAPGGTP